MMPWHDLLARARARAERRTFTAPDLRLEALQLVDRLDRAYDQPSLAELLDDFRRQDAELARWRR